MKIYLDLVFFLNFAFDFLLLLLTSYLLKRKAKIKTLVLAAFVGSISIITLFLPMNSIILFLFKTGISLLMVLISFGFKNKTYFFKNFLYLYLVSVLLGGLLYALNIQFSYKKEGLIFFYQGLSINMFLLFIIGPLLLYLYCKELKTLPLRQKVTHFLTVYLTSKKKFSLKAYLDTGNRLYDPYHHRPILLISSSLLEIPYEEAILVPYETVSGKGILKCRKVEKIVIDEDKTIYNVLVAKSPVPFHLEDAEAILHPDFMK